MELDPARNLLLSLMSKTGATYTDLSRLLGKNDTYMQQYVTKGSPVTLGEQHRERLGERFGVDPDLFRRADDPRRLAAVRAAAVSESDDATIEPRPMGAALRRRLEPTMSVDEIDVRAGNAEGGQIHEMHDRHNGERVVAQWQMPANVIRSYTSAPAERLKVITCVGDSNEPIFHPGQRVMVDTDDKKPSPPGFFEVWDGLGDVIKRLEVIAGSNPLRVRVSSANPAYQAYERDLADITINGRVIGRWQWT